MTGESGEGFDLTTVSEDHKVSSSLSRLKIRRILGAMVAAALNNEGGPMCPTICRYLSVFFLLVFKWM